MSEPHAALTIRLARAILAEIIRQSDEGELSPEWGEDGDLRVAWLDQGETDFGLVAEAALAAMQDGEP